MGSNGSGKSTLLNTLSGMRRPTRGAVLVEGRDPQSLAGRRSSSAMSDLVPQDPGLLLYGESVQRSATARTRCPRWRRARRAHAWTRVLPGMPADRHPRDLSEGQRLALALAIVVAPSPQLLLLDEPTRGLDYPSKDRLIGVLRELAAARSRRRPGNP